jgi:hypothetical protein
MISGISLAFILTGLLFPTQVSAATPKNGVGCAKANSTSKVGTKLYTCAKNPFLTPTKLTWTLTGCLSAYSLWTNAKQQYDDFVGIATLVGPEGVKTLADLQTSISSLEITMKTKSCVKGA